MSKVFKTEKGTELPLLNLKGKDYLQVAHRIQWFREIHPMGLITTEAVQIGQDNAVFKAKIFVKDGDNWAQLSEATKQEDRKGFADFIEKAETGAIGRALALAGFGTQFALPELDEGERLADAPVTIAKKEDIIDEKTTKKPASFAGKKKESFNDGF